MIGGRGRVLLSALDRYFEDVLCTISLAVVAGSVMIQVILRFVFTSASAWAEETAVFGMIFAVYLGASLAVRERAHIRITMLVNAPAAAFADHLHRHCRRGVVRLRLVHGSTDDPVHPAAV